jgi:hypothetical protein
VQRTECVKQVREEDSDRRAPSAYDLGLYHASVHEFLVEAEQEVPYEHVPQAPRCTELRDPTPERRCEHGREDNIRDRNHLTKIRLLRCGPVAPRSKPKLRQLYPRDPSHHQQSEPEETRHRQPQGNVRVEPPYSRQPQDLQEGRSEQETNARTGGVRRRGRLIKREQMPAQVGTPPALSLACRLLRDHQKASAPDARICSS